jgi:hypothetical protein
VTLPTSPPPLPAQEAQDRPPLIPLWGVLSRNRHVTVPLAVPWALAAVGVSLAVTPGTLAPVAAGAAVLTAVIWWAAPHKWTGKDGKPRWPEVWYARLSALALAGWLTWTAAAGPGPWMWWEAAVLAAGALAWGIPWWWHKRPRAHHDIVTEWNDWWQYHSKAWHNVAGSHVIGIETKGVIDTLKIQLWAGRQYLKDITDALPLIESALSGHVEAGMTRAEVLKGDKAAGIRGDASVVLLHLKRANPHDVEIEWEPARCPSSVTQPAPLGKNETGGWVLALLLANWFIIGKTRWGKSNQCSVMLASWVGCPDAHPPWIIDLKGGRSARPWANGADWVAITIAEARLVLAMGVAEVRARAEHWYTGTEQGVPTEEVPALVIFVDEAHGVLSTMSGDAQCRRDAAIIASEGSGLNVHLWVATQYGALDESVGTEQIRGNLPNRMCFAVSEPAHGQFALTDWAKLDASRLENKGEFYYRIGPDAASAPCRGPHMPHDLVRDITAASPAADRPPLVLWCRDQVAYYAGDDGQEPVTWQDIYDGRRDRLPASFRPGGQAAARPPQEASMNTHTPPAPALPPPPDSPAAIADRIEDELGALPDDDPSPVDAALLEDAITSKKRLWARLLQQAPDGGIKPAQLTAGSGLGRTWTHEQLNALMEMRVITRLSTGRYTPVPGQDVWAGLERIRRANDHVAGEARRLVAAGNSQ